MTAPERTAAQRTDALLKATNVRVARAELKRRINDDTDLDIARRIITDPAGAALELARELEPTLGFRPEPDWLDSMAVITVLLACRSLGAVKARAMMVDAWGRLSSTTRRLSGLHPQHRTTLAAALERHATRHDRRPAPAGATR